MLRSSSLQWFRKTEKFPSEDEVNSFFEQNQKFTTPNQFHPTERDMPDDMKKHDPKITSYIA